MEGTWYQKQVNQLLAQFTAATGSLLTSLLIDINKGECDTHAAAAKKERINMDVLPQSFKAVLFLPFNTQFMLDTSIIHLPSSRPEKIACL